MDDGREAASDHHTECPSDREVIPDRFFGITITRTKGEVGGQILTHIKHE